MTIIEVIKELTTSIIAATSLGFNIYQYHKLKQNNKPIIIFDEDSYWITIINNSEKKIKFTGLYPTGITNDIERIKLGCSFVFDIEPHNRSIDIPIGRLEVAVNNSTDGSVYFEFNYIY